MNPLLFYCLYMEAFKNVKSLYSLISLPRFTTPHHKEGFELFLDTISEMEDVWLVTSWQTIQWMR